MRLSVLLCAPIIFIAAAAVEPDLSLILYLVLVVPTVSVIFLNDAIRKKRGQRLLILLLLVIFWGASATTIENYSAVRTTAKWLIWSHHDKLEVLAQPCPGKW